MKKLEKPAKTRKPVRIGIAARIYAALGLLTALTIAASGIAWVSYGRVDETVDTLVEQKMPVVERALELAQAATMSTAIAGRFGEIRTARERSVLTSELDKVEQRQFELLRKIAESNVDKSAAQKAIDELASQINGINELTGQRLRNASEAATALALLDSAKEEFIRAIAKEAATARAELMLNLEGIRGLAGEEMEAALKTVMERNLVAFDVSRSLQAEINEVVGLLREIAQTDDSTQLGMARDRFQQLAQQARKNLVEAEKLNPDGTRGRSVETILTVGEGASGLLDVRDRDIITRESIAVGLKELSLAAEVVRKEVEALVRNARGEAVAASQSTTELIQQSKLWLGGLGVASLLAALALAVFYIRPMVVGRLNRLWSATRAIADGKLDSVVDAKGNDEISDIAKSVLLFRDNALALRAAEAQKIEDDALAQQRRREMMQELGAAFGEVVAAAAAGDFSRRVAATFADPELNALADSVNSLLETVQTGLSETCAVLAELSEGHLSARIQGLYQGAFAELKDGTNALAEEFESTLARLSETVAAVRSATSEILDGVTDLAERTTEESNAVSMATNQLGAFAGTVKKTASEAAQAMGMAESAEQRAQQGEKVVASALEAMHRIRSSSNKISEVIAMIDEIAFQTNLLALNAAVEAARAGDSGRGFAVVAAEVRSLAKRSADASNDVKRLVEAAHGDVAVGVGLVEETSSMFESIVASVNDLTGLMNGISQTARNQASDVSSINSEIDGIGTMAHQNAALVEETNAALALTDEQTRALTEHIGRFRFREGHVAEQGGREMAQAA